MEQGRNALVSSLTQHDGWSQDSGGEAELQSNTLSGNSPTSTILKIDTIGGQYDRLSKKGRIAHEEGTDV